MHHAAHEGHPRPLQVGKSLLMVAVRPVCKWWQISVHNNISAQKVFPFHQWWLPAPTSHDLTNTQPKMQTPKSIFHGPKLQTWQTSVSGFGRLWKDLNFQVWKSLEVGGLGAFDSLCSASRSTSCRGPEKDWCSWISMMFLRCAAGFVSSTFERTSIFYGFLLFPSWFTLFWWFANCFWWLQRWPTVQMRWCSKLVWQKKLELVLDWGTIGCSC